MYQRIYLFPAVIGSRMISDAVYNPFLVFIFAGAGAVPHCNEQVPQHTSLRLEEKVSRREFQLYKRFDVTRRDG